MIVLSDQGYDQTFGHSAGDPYLANTLVKQGELVVNYYAVAGSPLANEIALVSGQGPNRETATNCPTYDSFVGGGGGAEGQALGNGCIYPGAAPSVADQLTAANLPWKAYLQTRAPEKRAGAEQCPPPIGSSRGSQPTVSEPYATWRNPFLFFSSLTTTKCPSKDVALGQLATDLSHANTTPALSYIVADVCDDGSGVACAPGHKGGMAAADSFLKVVIPEIERSPAFKADGLIAVTFDNAPQTGPYADPSGCCISPHYPDMPTGSATGTTGATASAGSTSANVATGTPTTTVATGPTTTTTTTTTSPPTDTGPTTTTSTSGPTTTTSTTTTTKANDNNDNNRANDDNHDKHRSRIPRYRPDEPHRRRRSCWSIADLTLRPRGQLGRDRLLQPFLAVGQHRRPVWPYASRLRRGKATFRIWGGRFYGLHARVRPMSPRQPAAISATPAAAGRTMAARYPDGHHDADADEAERLADEQHAQHRHPP